MQSYYATAVPFKMPETAAGFIQFSLYLNVTSQEYLRTFLLRLQVLIKLASDNWVCCNIVYY